MQLSKFEDLIDVIQIFMSQATSHLASRKGLQGVLKSGQFIQAERGQNRKLITADLSIETLQAKREWQDVLKVMKEKNLQPRLLYPARISFKYEGKSESFTDKQQLREFSTTKAAHQQMLKDLLQTGNTKKVYKIESKTTK